MGWGPPTQSGQVRPFRLQVEPARASAASAPPSLSSHLELADVVGGDEDADADGDKDEAYDEESRQDAAGGEDGLPGRQALLLEGRVVRLAALGDGSAGRPAGGSEAAASRLPVRFGVVVHRHGGLRRL